MAMQKKTKSPKDVTSLGIGIVLFTAKAGCDAIKNKRHLQTLESIPKYAVGRPKKPSGYLDDTLRSSQDNKKQRKRMKQEHQKTKTKVHQY